MAQIMESDRPHTDPFSQRSESVGDLRRLHWPRPVRVVAKQVGVCDERRFGLL